MRILFLGDIVGRAGREAVRRRLPALRTGLAVDAVVANGENASGGIGLTADNARELLACGVDVLTLGNHVWRHKSLYSLLEFEPRVLRPANYPEGAPGRGLGVYDINGTPLAVLNLLGGTFMDPVDCPFRAADALLAELENVPHRLVDIHAEATSEKKALGWHLDGRASAVLGTHTHVQTADAMILPQGTGFLTDAGMCGVEASVLGIEPKNSVRRFLTRMPVPFVEAKGEGGLNGALVTTDATGRCTSISLVREGAPAAARA